MNPISVYASVIFQKFIFKFNIFSQNLTFNLYFIRILFKYHDSIMRHCHNRWGGGGKQICRVDIESLLKIWKRMIFCNCNWIAIDATECIVWGELVDAHLIIL